MREQLFVQKSREVLSLVTNVTYANVPSWYGATRRDLHMDLIIPKNRDGHAPCPALVWFCGGAFRVMDRSVWMPELMRFAEAGFVVASVEYRTGNEAVFPAPLYDAKAAIRFLRANAEAFCIDPNRIASMGESAGGALACLVGVSGTDRSADQEPYAEYPSNVQAVVDYYGLVDMTISMEGYEGNDIIPPWMLEEALGVRYTKEQALSATAIAQIDAQTPPHLILQGLADSIVSPEQSLRYYEKLRENGVEAELLELVSALHGDDLFFQDAVTDHVIAFLQKHLS